jgi:pantetheine-phosphate adenylyltransferase
MIVLFPGSFDPLTLGHEDLITRASKLFDHLIVAVGINENKQHFLTPDERVSLIQLSCKAIKNLEVISYSGLTVDIAKEKKASLIIRSTRNSIDFEYECQQAQMNKDLDNAIDTIFLPANQKYAHISSSLVRSIANLRGDLSPFVSDYVKSFLLSK